MKHITKLALFLFLIFSGVVNAQSRGTTEVRRWQINGAEREALIYIPATAKKMATPIVLLFHGHGGNMHEMFQNHNFQNVWPNAIIVVPQGLKTPGQLVDRAGNRTGWQQSPGDMNDRDIRFFDEILQSLRIQYRVDNHRIYATGHSNGGSFTYLLWAMRGDVFAAVAPSAAVAFKFNDMLRPKPVMHIMGQSDPLVKPQWQRMQLNKLFKLNNCSLTGRPFSPFALLYPSTLKTPVVVYVHPGGHVYPQEADVTVVKFFKSIVKL
jgi:polyhydroxybutyrate depolymerase